nr:MAG TPA: hypothetical protein [Caudoviricetes sp.]
MSVVYQGNFISIYIPEGEGNPPVIRLSDGYTYEKIHILVASNIGYLIPYMQIQTNYTLNFPCIDSKSPCTIQPVLNNTSAKGELKLLIEKFGQIPDAHYFDHAFEPISVTGDDGNEYNVIPSDQFK